MRFPPDIPERRSRPGRPPPESIPYWIVNVVFSVFNSCEPVSYFNTVVNVPLRFFGTLHVCVQEKPHPYFSVAW